MLLAVVVVAVSGAIFTTIFFIADADDIHKGIGQTEVWEPRPTDGGGHLLLIHHMMQT